MRSSSPEYKPLKQAREAEYQALWQVCDRAARKPEYLYSDGGTRRAILEKACQNIMIKRRGQGKAYCGIDIAAMVNLHIERENTGRLLANARVGVATPSPAAMLFMGNGAVFNKTPNPFPANPGPFNGSPTPFSASSGPFDGSLTAYNGSQAAVDGTQAAYSSSQVAYNAILQPQARVSPPSYLDFSIPGNTVQQDLSHLQDTLNTVINTLAAHDKRMATLERKLEEVTQERDMLEADLMKSDIGASTVPPVVLNYPVEGIEGIKTLAGVVYSQPRPLTPRSQTQGGDEDDREGDV
ncbi:hypothetical protein FBEOM_1982 [Fusarium beomiforme]|uniref:Uncharacterized protein n=1 Tax=Fusarium beomiforme TaxID=44412 RepID=A0A9P5E2A1_9HYPO|nr:hypothetical protein FBEOM_1982 [Fusarium beomiforme]